MSFSVFGPGAAYITRTDIANGTPVNIGFAQELSIDVSYGTKELYGQNQYALDVARGTAKTSGKMKAAQISGIALNAAFFGQSFSSGILSAVLAENHPVPATPFQVTVAPPSSGTFDTDLGVVNHATGIPMTKVASGPTAGQYSVSGAGVYLFASADNVSGVTADISFAYVATSAVAQKLVVTNQLIGVTPTFQLDYVSTHLGKPYYVRLFQCISSKLTQQFKLEDYMVPELDFAFFANAAGSVMTVGFPDVG